MTLGSEPCTHVTVIAQDTLTCYVGANVIGNHISVYPSSFPPVFLSSASLRLFSSFSPVFFSCLFFFFFFDVQKDDSWAAK